MNELDSPYEVFVTTDDQMKKFIESSRLEHTLKAIKAAFNLETLDEMSVLTGGGSTAKMFKFKVDGQYYVLRLMGLDQPIEERRIQVECAQYGTKLGLAPHCHYTNAEDGVIIMDCVNQLPLPKDVVLQSMPELLTKLHYSEKISKPFCSTFFYMNDLIAKMIERTPSQPIINYYKAIQEIMLILDHHKQLASCHNDLNSENVLYDGKQIYLIDFEAAGLEDPYFDLATVCQQNCFDPQEELVFLENYLQREPTPVEVSKLALMKQVSYCYHALHFFEHAYNANIMEFHDNVPTFKQWYEGRKEGKYSYDTPYDWMLYAMVVYNQSIKDMATPAFIKAKSVLNVSSSNVDNSVKKK